MIIIAVVPKRKLKHDTVCHTTIIFNRIIKVQYRGTSKEGVRTFFHTDPTGRSRPSDKGGGVGGGLKKIFFSPFGPQLVQK